MGKLALILPLAVSLFIMTLLSAQQHATDESLGDYPYLGMISYSESDQDINVNVRGGDGINYKILRVLSSGIHIIVWAKRDQWYEIELTPDSGLDLPVWVKDEFFDVSHDQAVCKEDRVVLRAAGTTDSAFLGLVMKEMQLKILDRKNNWLKVAAPQGTRAWVHADYVTYLKPYGQLESTEQSNSHSETGEIFGDDLMKNQDQSSTTTDHSALGESSVDAVLQNTIERSDHPSVPEDEQINQAVQNNNSDDVVKIRRLFEEKLQQLRAHAINDLESLDELSAHRNFTAAGHVVVKSGEKDRVMYQLELGSRVIYFLEAAQDQDQHPLVNLDHFSGKDVGVRGKIVEKKDGQRLIKVEEVVVLDSEK